MEDEINKLLDQILSTNHKIVSYLIEIAKMENEGKKINEKLILENPIIKDLFEKEQKYYRKIYLEIKEYKENDESGTNFGDVEIIINCLNDYVVSSFQALRYMPRNIAIYDEEGNLEDQVIEPSIFKDNKYQNFRKIEYQEMIKNIGVINRRLEFQQNLDCLSFFEKEEIIIDISEKKFYKDYAIKQINKYLEDLKIKKSKMTEDEYEKEKQQLIEKKYMYYYQYLDSKYNGILQENDIEYFRTIKKFIDDGLETVILDMDDQEISANIKMNFERPVELFKNNMKVILGPSNQKKLDNTDKKEDTIEKKEQKEEKIDEEAEK